MLFNCIMQVGQNLYFQTATNCVLFGLASNYNFRGSFTAVLFVVRDLLLKQRRTRSLKVTLGNTAKFHVEQERAGTSQKIIEQQVINTTLKLHLD